jgi:hypothetical protein
MGGKPACGDNSAVVQLRPTLEVVAPEHEVHLGEDEVRESCCREKEWKVQPRAKTRQHVGFTNEAGAPGSEEVDL